MRRNRPLGKQMPYQGRAVQSDRPRPGGVRSRNNDVHRRHQRKDQCHDPQRERSIGQQYGDVGTGFSHSLIKSALIRQSSDENVYLSARKSMTIRFYIHSIAKRAEAVALLDLGATENFINLSYAKWLKLLIKQLPTLQTLLNVDGTENKSRKLQFYTNLNVQTGATKTTLQFFLSDLGEHKAILGYPWFSAMQPCID